MLILLLTDSTKQTSNCRKFFPQHWLFWFFPTSFYLQAQLILLYYLMDCYPTTVAKGHHPEQQSSSSKLFSKLSSTADCCNFLAWWNLLAQFNVVTFYCHYHQIHTLYLLPVPFLGNHIFLHYHYHYRHFKQVMKPVWLQTTFCLTADFMSQFSKSWAWWWLPLYWWALKSLLLKT